MNEQSDGPSIRIALASAVGRRVEGLLDGTKGRGNDADAPLTQRMASVALAVMMVDLIAALEVEDRTATLERLANRLDDRGRVPAGGDAAKLLGATSVVLMRIGC